MKYCVNYNRELLASPLFEKIDEVSFKMDTSPNFFSFLNKSFKDKRIILEISTIDQVSMILEELNKYPDLNIILCLNELLSDEDADFIKESGLPYFYIMWVTSWDQLTQFINAGVSDVIIAGELGFELDKVHKVVQPHNIKVKVYPFLGSSSYSIDKKDGGLKNFFIRPEDVDIYGQYVDTLCFIGDKQLTYCQIYQEKQWFGNLREIISYLDCDLDSRFIMPNFGEVRVKCGKRCQKGRSCHICERIIQLSLSLRDGRIMVKGGEDNG